MIDVSTLSGGTIWMILGVIAIWTFLGFLVGKTVGMVAEQKRLMNEVGTTSRIPTHRLGTVTG